jgi:DNA-binding response OmpR family regulator
LASRLRSGGSDEPGAERRNLKKSSGAYRFPWYGDRSALVADEDSHTRKYLKEALARAGYAAHICGDTRRILESGTTASHSFLILRSGKPGMEVLRMLRKQGNPIPVILFSGAALDQQEPLVPDAGLVGRLSAPFTLESLRLAIAKVCQFDTPPLPRARGGR